MLQYLRAPHFKVYFVVFFSIRVLFFCLVEEIIREDGEKDKVGAGLPAERIWGKG